MYLELGFPYQIKYENPTMREISQATKASGVKSSLSRGTLPSKDFHSLDPDIFFVGEDEDLLGLGCKTSISQLLKWKQLKLTVFTSELRSADSNIARFLVSPMLAIGLFTTSKLLSVETFDSA